MYPRITAHIPVVQSATSLSASLSRRPPLFQDAWLVKPPTMDWVRATFIYPTSNKHQHQARGSTMVRHTPSAIPPSYLSCTVPLNRH
ncbi:unnamed protein product [Microthlaspi erraticum]|uniref:Uncharacterized protein n=1 Tax=Microthlaspi erraticum TaxID=1685480 RepID=A0A6D2L6L1_9BRAS|nr:unnamed protein product [Microthlaspi erraticum]